MKSATELADWVRDQIRHGEMVPGQRLVESDVAAATGATRAVIRAALQRLNADGLVVVEPYRGASIRRLTQREIENLYLIREVLEGLSARLAATRGGAPTALAEAQAQARAAAATADVRGFMHANQAWHAALLEMSANPDLTASLERLRVPTLRTLSRTFLSPDVVRAACDSQGRVTAAIEAGDPDEAEQAMRAHLRAGLAALTAADGAPAP